VLERVERQFSDLEAHPPVAVTDLAALFGRLCGRGLMLGVATMDSTAAVEAMLARFNARHQVRFVAGWDAGHGIKLDPGWSWPSAGRWESGPPRPPWSATSSRISRWPAPPAPVSRARC